MPLQYMILQSFHSNLFRNCNEISGVHIKPEKIYSRMAYVYLGAGKSLARPGRKQARKHVRDARDFNNIETRTVIKS